MGVAFLRFLGFRCISRFWALFHFPALNIITNSPASILENILWLLLVS